MKPLQTLLRICCLAIVVADSVVSHTEERPPNIVFIMADDLGYGDLSCFGQEQFETPRIDQLAAEGLKFTQHYAGSTVCAPSRCALMTGLHTGHCFIRGNREVNPTGQLPIPDEVVTLPEILKQSGYATGMFGKWGLGYPGSDGDPLNQGFDEFFGYNCQRNAHRYYPGFLWHNREQVPLDGKTYSQELILQHALDFIERHQQVPFFCYLPVTIPHAALELPDEEQEPFRKKFSQFEQVEGKYAGATYKNPAAAFAAMVTHLDADVGRVIDVLERLNLTENTLVIFTSDNGAHQEGGHDPRFFNSTGGLRGHKRDLYEGGIRVPTIAWWPGKIAAHRVSDFPCAAWDWLSTFAELAGVEAPLPPHDGLSIVPTLFDQQNQPRHVELYWEFHEQGGRQAIRAGDWKAVRLKVNKSPEGPVELYNMAEDPQETNDVAEEHPEIAQRLSERMAAVRTASEEFPFLHEPKKAVNH